MPDTPLLITVPVQLKPCTQFIEAHSNLNMARQIMAGLISEEESDNETHRWRNCNKIVHLSIRTGAGSKGSSPGAAEQIGQCVAFRKDQVDGGPGYNPTKFGNEIALNSKSAPGQGSTITTAELKVRTAYQSPGNSPAPKIFSAFGPGKQKG